MAGLSTMVVAVFAAVFVGQAAAHDWALGNCPRLQAHPNLSTNKFLGLWYVIEQFDTSSNCLTLNFSRVSETELRVTKLRQFGLLDQVGLDHTNSYSGSLDLPFGDDLGRMRVKWPLNMAGKGDYIIFDTDYETYAGIYECQPVTTLAHRKSAAILSRTPTLAPEYVARVKRKMTNAGISVSHFDKISHEGCRSRAEADVNIHVDSDTFSDILKGTRTGLEGAASTIADGFRNFAQSAVATVQSVSGDDSGSTNPDSVTPTFPSSSDSTGSGIFGGVFDGLGDTVNRAIQNVRGGSSSLSTFPSSATTPDEAVSSTIGETINTGFEESPEPPVFILETEGPGPVFPSETFQPTFDSGDVGVPLNIDFSGIDEGLNDINGVLPEETNGKRDENVYSINNADVEPVDDIVRTVVSIDKKKKK